VKTVYLIVFKRTKDGRCRFVQADGQLGSASSCAHPVLLGTNVNPSNGQAKVSWSRDLPRSLPAGRYDTAVRALDIAGNREPNRGDRTEVDFVVR
jgi:hypothetical protein